MPSLQKPTVAERYGVWKAHEGVCFWCKEPLYWRHFNLEHLLPKDLLDHPDELRAVLTRFNLPDDHEIHGFVNWVPAHASCNSRKNTRVFRESPAMIAALDLAERRAKAARRISLRLKKEPRRGELLARIEQALEAGVLLASDIKEFFESQSTDGTPVLLFHPAVRVLEDAERTHVSGLTLEELAWTVAGLAQGKEAERERLTRKHLPETLERGWREGDLERYEKLKRPAEAALRRTLEALDHTAIVALLALYYAGTSRHLDADGDVAAEFVGQLDSTWMNFRQAEWAVNQLMGKAQASDSLKWALEMLAERGAELGDLVGRARILGRDLKAESAWYSSDSDHPDDDQSGVD